MNDGLDDLKQWAATELLKATKEAVRVNKVMAASEATVLTRMLAILRPAIAKFEAAQEEGKHG